MEDSLGPSGGAFLIPRESGNLRERGILNSDPFASNHTYFSRRKGLSWTLSIHIAGFGNTFEAKAESLADSEPEPLSGFAYRIRLDLKPPSSF